MTAMCLGMLAVRLCLLRSSSARIVDLFLIGVTFAQARWLGVMVTKETRCVNTTLESYENLANHWRTVLGLDVEPWRLLAVKLLRLDRPIVSTSCLEGIAAIKDVVLGGGGFSVAWDGTHFAARSGCRRGWRCPQKARGDLLRARVCPGPADGPGRLCKHETVDPKG